MGSLIGFIGGGAVSRVASDPCLSFNPRSVDLIPFCHYFFASHPRRSQVIHKYNSTFSHQHSFSIARCQLFTLSSTLNSYENDFVEKIRQVCEGLVQNKNLHLHSIQFRDSDKTLDIRISLPPSDQQPDEIPESVPVEDLESINRQLGDIIEEKNMIPESIAHYSLEVSTPGVSDELTEDWQFSTFKGFLVNVETTELYKKKNSFSGSLGERTESVLNLSQKGRSVKIPLEIIKSVKLTEAKDETDEM